MRFRSSAAVVMSTPIRRIPVTFCCAQARIGQAAAAPPSSVMNSRRLMRVLAGWPASARTSKPWGNFVTSE